MTDGVHVSILKSSWRELYFMPARCSEAERKRFFREKRTGCLSGGILVQCNKDDRCQARKKALMEISSEFLFAPKKAFVRGKPKAKLPGNVSFGSFLCTKEKNNKKRDYSL